jgi:hypothetical protein
MHSLLWSVVEEMAAFSDAWPRSMLGTIVQDPTNGAGSVGCLHAVEQAQTG